MIPQGRQRAESGHEHKDADVLGVALVAALVLLIVAVSLLTARGVIRFAAQGERPVRPATRDAQFPEPRLEAHPVASFTATMAEAEKELHSYGWIDRPAGVVHMPIERATSLLLERGLPDVGEGQTRLQLMQTRPESDAQPGNRVGSPPPEGTVSP